MNQIPVTITTDGGQMTVNINPDDVLDLPHDPDISLVTITLAGTPVMKLHRTNKGNTLN